MTTDEKYKLSLLKEISPIFEDTHKRIHIVKDELTDRLYIKKVLPVSENVEFYRRLVTLEHRNLAKVHEVFQDDGNVYIIEEYVGGQTLKTLLENEGVQSEDNTVGYVAQVCDALIYLHNQNPPVIHRDIKPENIVRSDDGTIKLIDFDIAREHKATSKRDTSFMGTKEYAAPEQYGYKQTDCRTDIFSVGILIHELVTGRLPENDITYAGKLRRVIDKCIEIDPDKRFQSAYSLKKALTGAIAKGRRKINIVLSMFALIGVTIGVFIYFRLTGDSNNNDNYNSKHANLQSAVQPEEPKPEHEPIAGLSTDTDSPSTPKELQNEPAEEITAKPTENQQSEVEPLSIDTTPTESAAPEKSNTEQAESEPKTDLHDIFNKIDSFEEKPAILLEYGKTDETIRSITGGLYDNVINAFQEYYAPAFLTSYYAPDTDELGLSVCNMKDGYVHDMAWLEMGGDYLSVAYFDADSEVTYFFTTKEDKGLLSPEAFYWVTTFHAQYENPVVFSQAPLSKSDIIGVYNVGNTKQIEIFEEGDEMKFSYTARGVTGEMEPLFTETINKLDDSHYWIENITVGNKNRLMFNFSKNHLTLFTELYEQMINLEGIYNKQ